MYLLEKEQINLLLKATVVPTRSKNSARAREYAEGQKKELEIAGKVSGTSLDTLWHGVCAYKVMSADQDRDGSKLSGEKKICGYAPC
jgi:hypothetical protein